MSSQSRNVSSPKWIGGIFFCSLVALLWIAMTQKPPSPYLMLAVCALAATGLLLFNRMSRELRDLDRTLGQSERYIESIAELSQDLHALFEIQTGRYLYINAAVTTMLGFTPQELKDGGVAFVVERVHPDDRPLLERHLSRIKNAPPPSPGEPEPVQEEVYRIRNKWDEYRWFRTRRQVFLRDGAGQVQDVLAVSHDISEQKALEMALVQSQEYESLGTLTRGVVHDLNNILMGIQGQVELASERPGEMAFMGGVLQGIHQGALRASQLCRQLLSYSKRGRIQVAPHQLNDTVREALSIVQSLLPETAQLEVELEADIPLIQADPVHVKHALLNLVANALDSLGNLDGDITLRTSLMHLGAAQGYAPGGLEGDFVCLEVRDTGQGMSEDTLNTIFTPRYGGRFPDRGLGMLGVQWIAKEHKGAVDLITVPEEGTTLRVFFPLAGREPGNREEDEITAITSSAGVVLVVDDEPTLRSVMRMALEQQGYQVIEAVDGVDGFGAFVRHRSSIVLVLLDLTMPRMNGDLVFQEIHNLSPHTPVILMSGYSQQEAIAALPGKGPAGFLQKPCSVKELQAAVSRILRRD